LGAGYEVFGLWVSVNDYSILSFKLRRAYIGCMFKVLGIGYGAQSFGLRMLRFGFRFRL
jgi:hypothetical protein